MVTTLISVHCDLKPENILLESKTDNVIKIIDLGLSQIKTANKSLNVERGSIYYLAPEMIMKKYDHKVDIWSSGVIFYILLTGKPPFNSVVKNKNGATALNSESIKKKILKGKVNYDLPVFKAIGKEIIQILKSMLTYNPKERPEAEELLKHPFFTKKTNWDEKPESNNITVSLNRNL